MSLFVKIRNAITWPARKTVVPAVHAVQSAGRKLAMDLVKQFLWKAAYGFLAGLIAILSQAGGVHSDNPQANVVWALIIGGLTGAVALVKKLGAKALGVDPSGNP